MIAYSKTSCLERFLHIRRFSELKRPAKAGGMEKLRDDDLSCDRYYRRKMREAGAG